MTTPHHESFYDLLPPTSQVPLIRPNPEAPPSLDDNDHNFLYWLCSGPKASHLIVIADNNRRLCIRDNTSTSEKAIYEQAGVQAYVVVVLRQQAIRWWVLQHGTYHEIAPDADGVFRSRVFPGLWLHAEALLQRQGRQLLDALRQGLATPEHAAFVQRLQPP